ncbi:MAG: dipeptidase [Planctomycetes bacterium]|nr:dipeptidase [Planctomycetota bacterium]
MKLPELSPAFKKAQSFISSREAEFRERLFEFLRFPSVSSDSRRRGDVARCAEWVRKRMREAGLKVELVPTEGHPIVYGERPGRPGGPALLVYGHYDVQPADPSKEPWRQDPFEPVVESGSVVARGASDDKGQVLALLCGIRAALEAGLGEDLHLKVLIEGEEEVGSQSLMPFVSREKERLRAEAVVIADSTQFAAGLPAITYGLRGILCLEIIVRGPKKDLHSGSYGGAVANPAMVLARMVAACHAPFGKVAIPGFYDKVRPLDDQEREEIRKLPFSDREFQEEVGAPKLWGEEGYSVLERRWARPTFEVNGLVSGHTGEGMKTVLPAEARAKISMRLVPDQDPEEIGRLASEYIQSLAPASAAVEVKLHHGARPVLVRCDTGAVRAAMEAIAVGFGREPVFVREGGSIPVVNTFKEALGTDSILIGLGLPDDGAHGPNEKFSLDDFRRGMVTMAALIEKLGKTGEGH